MSRLIESIKLNDGVYHNVLYHEQRMNRSLNALYGMSTPVKLEQLLDKISKPDKGLYKCRILYDDASREVNFIPYVPKNIQTLKIVYSDTISYEHKYADRSALDALVEQREEYDDILIVKNGLITDSSYANILFQKDKVWYTPATPLLRGTMRQVLIDQGAIFPDAIRKEDIPSFQHFKLINAMIGFDGLELDISKIITKYE